MKLSKEDLLQQLTPELKKKGYKKKNKTWMLKSDKLSIILNIQSSSYSDDYYINFGVYLEDLGGKVFPSISDCHISERLNIDVSDVNKLIKALDLWNEWYGNIDVLRKKAIENKLPVATHRNAITYLTSNAYANVLHKLNLD